MHGARRGGKQSGYGERLREKQKLKRFYQVSEKQFRRFFELASRSPENTGGVLISLMERRLDNIVHRLGFAVSHRAARQLIAHGHIKVNGRCVDVSSYLVKVNDTITVKAGSRSQALVRLALQENPPQPPDYLERGNGEHFEGRVLRVPGREDVDPRIKDINEQLIIEFCSR
jgi:small subunit ribosomal protein S4